MATLFFSGIDRPAHLSLLIAERAAGMMNVRNAMQPQLRKAYSRPLPIPLALDSFQEQRGISCYTEIIEQIGEHFLWISNLDVLFNQTMSNRHFEYLQQKVWLRWASHIA